MIVMKSWLTLLEAIPSQSRDSRLDQDSNHLQESLLVLSILQAYNIEGAELTQMGQATVLGAYPIHYHMAHDVDNVTNPSVQGNSIHHCFSRCVTIHGSHGVHVKVIFNGILPLDMMSIYVLSSRTMLPLTLEAIATSLKMAEKRGQSLTTILDLELAKDS